MLLFGNVTSTIMIAFFVLQVVKQKSREAKANDSLHKLNLVARSAKIGTWNYSNATGRLHWNDIMHQIYDVPRDEFSGRYEDWLRHVHPDDRNRAEADYRTAAAARRDYQSNFRILRRDGQVRHIRAFCTFLQDDRGEPGNLIGINIDLTDDEQAKRELALYKLAFDNAQDGMMITDGPAADHAILAANAAFETISGHAAADIIGRNPRFMTAGLQRQSQLDAIRDALAAGRPVSTRLQNRRRDGNLFWQDLSISPVIDPETGDVIAAIGIQHDVTREVAADAAMRETNQQLSAINRIQQKFLAQTPVAQDVLSDLLRAFLDSTGSRHGLLIEFVFRESGPPALRLAGMRQTDGDAAAEQGEAASFDEFLAGVQPAGRRAAVAAAANAAAWTQAGPDALSSMLGIPLRHGEDLLGIVVLEDSDLGYNAATIADKQPLIVTAVNILKARSLWHERLRYIEDLKAAKIAAERYNAAKSRFLANMSHELRTPLNSILGYSELITLSNSSLIAERGIDYARRIHESGRILLSHIEDILGYAQIEAVSRQPQIEALEARSMVARVLWIMKLQLSQRRIKIRASGCCGDLAMAGDERNVIQVLTNILSNAAKYSPAGSTIKIAFDHAADRVSVRIDDEGKGIMPDKLEEVFQPFNRGGSPLIASIPGTGLGLAISRSLMREMGGDIVLSNRPAGGLSVALHFRPMQACEHLPVAPKPVQRAGALL